MQPTSESPTATKANGPAPSPGETNGAAVNDEGRVDLHELLQALQAVRVGDFSVRMAGDHVGILGKIADTFNEIVAENQRMAKELERVGEMVGREGRTRQRVRFGVTSGAWGEMENSVNTMIDDLLWTKTEVTRAVGADG